MDKLENDFVRLAFIESMTYEQIESELGISRLKVRELWNSLDAERKEINKVKQLYNRKDCKDVPFRDFYEMYIGHERKCYYCGITQGQIDRLFTEGKIETKRSSKRGRTLELERLLSEEKYSNLNNLRLACYWCNNAKSDEFTEEEFRLIGMEIGKVLKERLLK